MKKIKEILQINRHLKILNQIGQSFHFLNDIKIPLKLVMENISKEMKLDEITILLYKKQSQILDSVLCATERGILEGEESIPVGHKNEFFASLLHNEKNTNIC